MICTESVGGCAFGVNRGEFRRQDSSKIYTTSIDVNTAYPTLREYN